MVGGNREGMSNQEKVTGVKCDSKGEGATIWGGGGMALSLTETSTITHVSQVFAEGSGKSEKQLRSGHLTGELPLLNTNQPPIELQYS